MDQGVDRFRCRECDRLHGVVGPARRARLLVTLILGFVLAGFVVLGGVSPADAHAELDSSTPAADAVVAKAPTTVTLTFSENVNVGSQDVRVLDDKGKRVDKGNTHYGRTNSEVVVGLDSGLADGTYVVDWRAISADSHPVHGGFQFSIGKPSVVDQAAVDAAAGGGSDTAYQVAAGIARFFAYTGALLAAGGVLFRWWRRDPDVWAGGLVVATGAGVALLALAVQVPLQAALSTGGGLTSIADEGVLTRVLSEGFGMSIAVSAVGLVALIALAGWPNKEPVRTLGFIASLLAVGGFAVSGHTRSMTPGWLSYLADGAHLLAAAVWFGGLVQLAGLIRRARRDGTAADGAYAVADFSALAAWALAGVVVAGSALGWMEVRSIHALVSTTYGRVLMLKVGTVLLVIAAGAWNRYRLVPVVAGDALAAQAIVGAEGAVQHGDVGAAGEFVDAPASATATSRGVVTIEAPPTDPAPEPSAGGGDGGRRDTTDAWRRLHTVVLGEIVGIVVVLALTAVLVNLTPARNAVAKGGLYNATQPMGNGTANLVVDPAKAGRNSVHVYLLDAKGGADDRATSVTFELSLPEKQLGPIDRQPVKVAPGHYQLLSNDLLYPGQWTIVVKARVSKFEEDSASFKVPVG